MTISGRLIDVDGRPALRFERRLNGSVERVWRAVTAPDELARWFVVPVPWTPRAGESFESFGTSGTVLELEEPRVIAWEWSGDVFRFELAPDAGGCLLVFTHVFDDRNRAVEQASGWDGYLDRLELHLDGRYVSDEELFVNQAELRETYAKRFDNSRSAED